MGPGVNLKPKSVGFSWCSRSEGFSLVCEGYSSRGPVLYMGPGEPLGDFGVSDT